MSRVGIITVTYNSGKVIDDFCKCLTQDHADSRVYVIDNDSSDETVATIERAGIHNLTIIRSQKNLGFAAGVNIGLKAALADACDYVLLINNDTVFAPDLVSRLVAAQQRTGAGALAPKILDHGSGKIWCAGGYYIPWLAYLARHFGAGETDHGQYDVERQVTFLSGCCLLLTSDVVREHGGLDESYFVYCEDLDYCFRLRNNVRFIYTPDAVLMHKASSLTGGGNSPFSIFQIAHNYAIFTEKNFSGSLRAYFHLLHRLNFIRRMVFPAEGAQVFWTRWKAYSAGIKSVRDGGSGVKSSLL